jgi:hypothetical protein
MSHQNQNEIGSAFEMRHSMIFPPILDKRRYEKKEYHCLVITFSGGYKIAVCGDSLGMHGEGDNKEDALNDLKRVMEASVEGRDGMVFPETSSPEEQSCLLQSLLDRYRKRGNVIEIVSEYITLF